jgi:acyl dehydratase
VAAGDPNPIHLDPAAARAAGLDAPVVQGMLLMGQFDPSLRDWFPGARVSRLHALFMQPVPVDTPVTISGRRVPPTPKSTHIVRLFARAGDSTIACVGEATLRTGPATPAA